MEAKAFGKDPLEFTDQMAGYVRGNRHGMAVLTNGQKWYIWNLSETNRLAKRNAIFVDIFDDQQKQAARTLNLTLGRRYWWSKKLE